MICQTLHTPPITLEELRRLDTYREANPDALFNMYELGRDKRYFVC